jgi:PAS domain-containing protein
MEEISKKFNQIKELELMWNEKAQKMSQKDRELAELYSLTDHLPRLTWDNDFRIIHANQSFLDALGYDLLDIMGKRIFNEDGTSDFITTDTLGASYDTIADNLKSGVEWVHGTTNKWYAKDGSEVKIKWLIGFNHPSKSFGTTQCKFV